MKPSFAVFLLAVILILPWRGMASPTENSTVNLRSQILGKGPEDHAGPQGRGGVGDGGGSGIACFDQEMIARDALDAQGRLKDSYRPLITSIWVTDFVETNGAVLFQAHPNESLEEYLVRLIDEKIKPLSALFSSQLISAIHQVRFELWQPTKSLLPILDRGGTPIVDARILKSKKCIFVQIVRSVTTSENHKLQINTIEYDRDLFSKLVSLKGYISNSGFYNQAILLLHEALYLMGRQGGHKMSVKARWLAGILMQNKTYFFVKDNFDFLGLLKNTNFIDIHFSGYLMNSLNYNFIQKLLEIRSDYFRKYYGLTDEDCLRIENRWMGVSCDLLISGVMTTFKDTPSLLPLYERMFEIVPENALLVYAIEEHAELTSFLIVDGDSQNKTEQLCTSGKKKLDFYIRNQAEENDFLRHHDLKMEAFFRRILKVCPNL